MRSSRPLITKSSFGGYFDNALGKGIARLLPDGTKDPTFNAAIPGSVLSIEPLDDGKILIAGNFYTVEPTRGNCLAILNQNGSPDSTFDSGVLKTLSHFGNSIASATIYAAKKLPSGDVVAVGDLLEAQGTYHVGAARFDKTGKLLPGLMLSPTNWMVRTLAVDKGGKTILGAANWLQRFLPDGTPDPSLPAVSFARFRNSSGSGQSPVFSDLLCDSNGRIIVGGEFDTVNGLEAQNMVRIISNFAPPTVHVTKLNDQVTCTIQGTPAPSCRIETSPDLLHWSELSTPIPFTGVTKVILEPDSAQQQFIRAALPQ
jgi:hypothetical protein